MMSERTWKIREYISGLERVKDEIIEYLATRTDLDDSTRNLWTSDTKECYYSIVAAWQMLSSALERNSQFRDSARNFLKAAESRLAQVSSELTSLDTNEARLLNQEVEESFNYCHLALSAELERLSAENLSRIHGFMKKHYKGEGLDAYCPKCGKIYCARHYQTREEYDEGYYDCTYGTCPKGHKRIIHD